MLSRQNVDDLLDDMAAEDDEIAVVSLVYRFPVFVEQYARARELQAEYLVDEIMTRCLAGRMLMICLTIWRQKMMKLPW
jgi:hypothetical protein